MHLFSARFNSHWENLLVGSENRFRKAADMSWVRRKDKALLQLRSRLNPLLVCLFIFPLILALAKAQTANLSVAADDPSPSPQAAAGTAGSPRTITFQDALQMARKNSPQFNAAVTDLKVAHEDRVQARAALLPNVSYNSQYLYTQGNGTPSSRFIANNGVHEYIAEGNAHQVLFAGGQHLAEYHRAGAAEALARAKSEIAARGLVVTVTQAYYALVVAERKYANAQRSAAEAQRFLTISQQLEHGGEVAHSDSIKAEIQFQQQQQALQEAQLAMSKARLDLAVLIFPNFFQDFTVVDDLRLPEPLPTFDEVQALGTRNNPDLRAAMSALRAADADVSIARAGYFPTIALDYWYGIDSNVFATHSITAVTAPNGEILRERVPNLGYSASAALQLPIWNWGATRSKVRQATLRRRQARVELSFAQRELLANLRNFYNEAETARAAMERLGRAADLAADSLRLTSLRYQAGEATVLEVVDAQNTLTQARNAFDDGQARFRISIANLQTLTGNF
jgi:outer membrane protein TolC